MLTAFWAAKGGSGATVVAAATALAAPVGRPVLLVDLDGDLPTVLGLGPASAGVADWLRAGDHVPADALDRLIVPVTDSASLLPRGEGPLEGERAAVLARMLATGPRHVVVDAGTRPTTAGRAVVRSADRSVLVTRACYVALRRLATIDLAASEVVLIREPSRALTTDDVAEVAGAPVRTVIGLDPAIARAVDSGLLSSRLPRVLARAVATGPRR